MAAGPDLLAQAKSLIETSVHTEDTEQRADLFGNALDLMCRRALEIEPQLDILTEDLTHNP
jgi:hypothetical protein